MQTIQIEHVNTSKNTAAIVGFQSHVVQVGFNANPPLSEPLILHFDLSSTLVSSHLSKCTCLIVCLFICRRKKTAFAVESRAHTDVPVIVLDFSWRSWIYFRDYDIFIKGWVLFLEIGEKAFVLIYIEEGDFCFGDSDWYTFMVS